MGLQHIALAALTAGRPPSIAEDPDVVEMDR
jgi:hypothetical protein